MALDDKTIFELIFERHKDQPIEFVMEQFGKAKKLYSDIEQSMANKEVIIDTPAIEANPEEAKEEAPAKKRYTRRSLKFKPEEAITEDYIKCCLCGHEGQILNKNHFDKHGITADEYRKLCGYDKKQPLMSHKRFSLMRSAIDKARVIRDAKKAEKSQSK